MHIFYLVNSKNKTTNTINNFSIKDDRKRLINNSNNNNSFNNIINNNGGGSSSDDNENIEDNDSNGKNRIDQFPHQVGGHSAMLSIEGNICKPLINRELQFYEFSQLRDNVHSFFISPFIANFYGVVDVLKSKNEELPSSSQQQQPTTLQSQQQQQQQYNNIINNNNKNKIKDCKHPSGTQQSYIVLQDLTVDYKKPCIVDIKIGTRQRGAICSSTTSTSHGIRVCGMKIYSPELGNIVFDRYYGRTLNFETLEDSLLNFFTNNILNSSNNNNNNINSNSISIDFHLQRITLIESIIQKLSQIECILSNKNERFPFKIYSSSLLIIYEGNQGDNEFIQKPSNNNNNNNNNIEINNNPFNDSSSSSSAASSCTTTPSQSPTTNLLNSDSSIQNSTDSFLENNNNSSNNIVNNNSGNMNIQRNINLILDPLKTLNRNSSGSSSSSSSADITMVEDMEDGFQSFASEEDVDESYISSDLDSDSDEIDSTRSRSNSKSKSSKPTSSSTSLQSIKNDVKMIDFAHAIPVHEKDAAEDDGYIFGIQNLQLLLFKIKSRLLFSLNIQQLTNSKNNSINNINNNNNNSSIDSEPSSPIENSTFSSLSNSSTIIEPNNNNNNNSNNNYGNEGVSGNFDYSFMKMFNHQNYQQSQSQEL